MLAKFKYGYRTRENEPREGVLRAASREDVYVKLKREGIKPVFVDLAPGWFNWVLSVGKRWIAIVTLAIALLCMLAVVVLSKIAAAPSESYRQLEREMANILALAEEDCQAARAELRDLFAARFETIREKDRELAMSLYGRVSMEIDSIEYEGLEWTGAESEDGACDEKELEKNPKIPH